MGVTRIQSHLPITPRVVSGNRNSGDFSKRGRKRKKEEGGGDVEGGWGWGPGGK